MWDKYTTLSMFLKIYDRISPKFPESIRGRISRASLHFKNYNKGPTISQKIRQSVSQSFQRRKARYSNSRNNSNNELELNQLENNNKQDSNNDNDKDNDEDGADDQDDDQDEELDLESPTPPVQLENEIRENAINEQLTEGNYERYFNMIHYRKVVILVLAAVVLQIAMSGATYLKFGDYIFMRDAAITTELIVTIIVAITVIVFPKTTSRVQVIYLQILLLTNNMTRLMWKDWFPPYEPSYQIFLWINISLPTAKFSRSIFTGTVGIMSIVIIRLAQSYDSVVNIVIGQGAAYMLYQISTAIGNRITEVSNRALFAELVMMDPFTSPLVLYRRFELYRSKCANWFSLKFHDRDMEKTFQEFYAKESILEVGVVISTVATSIYYVIQDISYAREGTLILFTCLRFIIIVPVTISLLYLSMVRRSNPFKADFMSLVALIVLVIVQVAMYTQTSTWDGSLFYFGGVMRALTLGSSQLFFIFFAVLLPFTFVLVPFALLIYSPSTNINYMLFLVIFAIIVTVFSYLREQTQRLRYLVKYYNVQVNNLSTTNNNLQQEKEDDQIQIENEKIEKEKERNIKVEISQLTDSGRIAHDGTVIIPTTITFITTSTSSLEYTSPVLDHTNLLNRSNSSTK